MMSHPRHHLFVLPDGSRVMLEAATKDALTLIMLTLARAAGGEANLKHRRL